jgi:hypothetical protein
MTDPVQRMRGWLEPFLSWYGLRRFAGLWGTWAGVAPPDGIVLTVRDASSHEIYALELQLR